MWKSPTKCHDVNIYVMFPFADKCNKYFFWKKKKIIRKYGSRKRWFFFFFFIQSCSTFDPQSPAALPSDCSVAGHISLTRARFRSGCSSQSTCTVMPHRHGLQPVKCCSLQSLSSDSSLSVLLQLRHNSTSSRRHVDIRKFICCIMTWV